jgi:hypothetical protein
MMAAIERFVGRKKSAAVPNSSFPSTSQLTLAVRQFVIPDGQVGKPTLRGVGVD